MNTMTNSNNTLETMTPATSDIDRIFPTPQTSLSLDQALTLLAANSRQARDHAEETNRARQRLREAEHFAHIPIIAVTGTINSGKSTMVSTFLSKQGAERVLIGNLGRHGTQRFVFWLPETWKDKPLGAELANRLRQITKCVPEYLSEEPAEAAKQYNAGGDLVRQFNTPLIAYDPALDEKDIAFLDCPDIQRPLDDSTVSADASTSHLRLERLRTLSPLCSAFIIVASMEQLQTEIVGAVFRTHQDVASNAPLWFILNKIEPANMPEVMPDVEAVYRRWRAEEKVRQTILSPRVNGNGRIKPEFYNKDQGPCDMADAARQLDPAELQSAHRDSCRQNLARAVQDAYGLIDQDFNEKRRRIHDAHQKLIAFLNPQFVDEKGGLRVLFYNEFGVKLNEAIIRKAPRFVRMTNQMGNLRRKTFDMIKSKTKWVKKQVGEEDVTGFELVSGGEFANHLQGSAFLPPETSRENLTDLWNGAVARVEKLANEQKLDLDKMDALAARLWKQTPGTLKWKLLRNVLIAAAAFTFAGMVLPFDGGASLVIVTKANIVLGGGELLLILVGAPLAGSLFTLPAAREILDEFQNHHARPQINNLWTALCDGFGIPWTLDNPPALNSGTKVVHTFEAAGHMGDSTVGINVPGGPVLKIQDGSKNI